MTRSKDAFDLVILGGGASAFAAAIKANDLGARTAMINRGLPLGGTCVNVGCVPSKTLLWAAEVLHHANHHGIPGLDLAVRRFDFGAVVRDEQALVERMRRDKYQKVLEQLAHVTFVDGRARLVSPTAIEVSSASLACGDSPPTRPGVAGAARRSSELVPVQGV